MIISEENFPNIKDVLERIAGYNGAINRVEGEPLYEIPDKYDFKYIEERLKELSEEERDILSDGEFEESQSLVKSKGLKKVDEFLNDFFSIYL
jgi:hypothetical protein